MGLASLCNHRADPALPEQSAVLVVVVATVGQQRVRPSARSADPARDGRNLVEQGQELGDVVAIAAGQTNGQGDASCLGDDVVFRARLGAVDRARTGFGPPLSARTCELSITALDQSSWPAACTLLREKFSTICLVWADGGYAGRLVTWAGQVLGLDVSIVRRSDDLRGFVVLRALPQGQVVKAFVLLARVLKRLAGRCRCLARSCG